MFRRTDQSFHTMVARPGNGILGSLSCVTQSWILFFS
jgi:hypothetical protein